ncbi:hypothetical protein GBA52_008949 [Prunus armeniaca]|nr:hypothetical protein GBA52_008949 [Prunus armeniaca]
MEENQSILLFLHQKKVKYKDYFSVEIMDQVNLHRINDLPETLLDLKLEQDQTKKPQLALKNVHTSLRGE